MRHAPPAAPHPRLSDTELHDTELHDIEIRDTEIHDTIEEVDAPCRDDW
ncbi:hypothetical protein ACGFOU_00545 [Streptomyces sp. NPDC048595]